VETCRQKRIAVAIGWRRRVHQTSRSFLPELGEKLKGTHIGARIAVLTPAMTVLKDVQTRATRLDLVGGMSDELSIAVDLHGAERLP
jgi:hypothetical protein